MGLQSRPGVPERTTARQHWAQRTDANQTDAVYLPDQQQMWANPRSVSDVRMDRQMEVGAQPAERNLRHHSMPNYPSRQTPSLLHLRT